MIWRFIDRAKGVAVAAGAASLLAVAGVVMLAASGAATLAIWMPWPAALATTAVGFLAVAAIAMWVGVQPAHADKNDDKDGEQASAAAMALVDLPLEAAKRIITERPVAAIVLVSGFGLLIARRPQIAMKVVDKILERFG
ncbi:MAG: hypothetical protein Q8R02_24335 [Hyphomonadaceae bacterium]|nr:hypothetical protein [Hyphomonadaceae bacterium]